MPLFAGYRDDLKSQVADLHSTGKGSFAGSVRAALFLENFVGPDTNWVHFDLYAWNNSSRPGRPEGGETFLVRALVHWMDRKFGRQRDEAPDPKRPAGKTQGRKG
jgi:leucyl aminopeptidase